MAITKTTDLTNSVVTDYQKAYYLHADESPGVWGQFIDWQTPVSENGGSGSTIDFPIYGEADLVETALTEDADVTPDSITDGNVTITPAEYGKTFAVSKKARYQSRTNLDQIMGRLVSANRVKSIDRILRRSACGRGSSYPTQTLHIDGSAAMSSLTANSSADTITYAFIEELGAQAAAMGIEPFKTGGFVAIIHPLLAYDIRQLTEWKSIGYYQDKMNIYEAIEKPFTLGGITFVTSRMGRIYMASGTAIQGATTTTAAVNKGGTTLPVTEMTGLAAGSYVAVGTVETESTSPGTNLEVVYVTAQAGASGAGNLTVRANGVGDNFGFRFNHASGEAVTEAYNVAAIPIIGKNSLIGVYGSDTGQYGKAVEDDTKDILKRIKYYGWYWYGGVGVVQKHLLLGKCALSKWVTGYN